MKREILYNTIQRGMPMILYVDETECDKYFIVAGLLTKSKNETTLAYKHFKKKLQTMKISPKEKQKVFYEFKATYLDRHYQRVKIKMLLEIKQLEGTVLFTTFEKKLGTFTQIEKEEQYIKMLNCIVSFIIEDVDIIFDGFNKKDFENRIITSISSYEQVLSVQAGESFAEEGLQFVDNVCSAIRLFYTDKNKEFYEIIKENIIKV